MDDTDSTLDIIRNAIDSFTTAGGFDIHADECDNEDVILFARVAFDGFHILDDSLTKGGFLPDCWNSHR